MAAIVLIAALLGGARSYKILRQAWKGEAPAATGVDGRRLADIPLPLGLMQAKELHGRKEALFIDARDGATYAEGHIAGARSLPLGELDARLPRLIADVPPTTLLVIYCNGYGCHDSRDLGAGLLRAGYRQVYVFEGGYPEWREAGYPVGRGKP